MSVEGLVDFHITAPDSILNGFFMRLFTLNFLACIIISGRDISHLPSAINKIEEKTEFSFFKTGCQTKEKK